MIAPLKSECKVFIEIVSNCLKAEFLSVVRGRVQRLSLIHIDVWKAHDGLVLDGFRHDRVQHSENDMVPPLRRHQVVLELRQDTAGQNGAVSSWKSSASISKRPNGVGIIVVKPLPTAAGANPLASDTLLNQERPRLTLLIAI